MAELLTKSFDGRKTPVVNDRVLDKVDNKPVYDCSDLCNLSDNIVGGRLKLSPELRGWIPFVWNYHTNEIKLLEMIDGECVKNSIYIGRFGLNILYGQAKFADERWYTFKWNYLKNTVDYDLQQN